MTAEHEDGMAPLIEVSRPPVDEGVVQRLAEALFTPDFDECGCDEDHEHSFACFDPDSAAYWVDRVRRACVIACGTTPVSNLVPVAGVCPMGCGETLILLEHGRVSCSSETCPRPLAVTELLADAETEHVVDFGHTSFTVRHPLRERLDNELMTCDVHAAVDRTSNPLLGRRGTYRVVPSARGWGNPRWEAL